MLRGIRVAAVTILVGALVAGGEVAATSASAADAPSLAVSPSGGLRDGQTVTATGSGFQAEVVNFGQTKPGQATVALCKAQIGNGGLNMADLCSATGVATVPVDQSGRFSASPVAPRVSLNVFGQPIDCTTGPDACVWLAFEFVGFAGPLPIPTVISASAPVSFRAQTFADCQATRWQTFTDGRGRPFRSQFGCRLYVFVSWLISSHHR